MKEIDARGLSCPQPVVLTDQAIRNGETHFKILVNSNTSKENVLRLIRKSKIKFKTEILENGEDTIIEVSQ
jgi:tRNA 2-thiouridine synthesizing protein A